MRWDNLMLSPDEDALFGAERVVERTFDTPEFRGMTFYEVRARSVINNVPGGSRLSFGFAPTPPERGGMTAIRTSTRVGVDAVREVLRWPDSPTDEWYGF